MAKLYLLDFKSNEANCLQKILKLDYRFFEQTYL